MKHHRPLSQFHTVNCHSFTVTPTVPLGARWSTFPLTLGGNHRRSVARWLGLSLPSTQSNALALISFECRVTSSQHRVQDPKSRLLPWSTGSFCLLTHSCRLVLFFTLQPFIKMPSPSISAGDSFDWISLHFFLEAWATDDMDALIHQRKFSAPEDQSLNIDAPPPKVSLKRKAVNAAKSTAWYTSAAVIFVLALCHTLVCFFVSLFNDLSSLLSLSFSQIMYVLVYRWFKGIPLDNPFWWMFVAILCHE